MVEARIRHDWDQTSLLASMLANLFRDKNKKAMQPRDFHPCPHPLAKKRKPLPGSIMDLKALLPKGI